MTGVAVVLSQHSLLFPAMYKVDSMSSTPSVIEMFPVEDSFHIPAPSHRHASPSGEHKRIGSDKSLLF